MRLIRDNFLKIKDRVPVGKPGSGLGQEIYKVDSSLAKKELGMTFRSLKETVIDTVKSLLELEQAIGKA